MFRSKAGARRLLYRPAQVDQQFGEVPLFVDLRRVVLGPRLRVGLPLDLRRRLPVLPVLLNPALLAGNQQPHGHDVLAGLARLPA